MSKTPKEEKAFKKDNTSLKKRDTMVSSTSDKQLEKVKEAIESENSTQSLKKDLASGVGRGLKKGVDSFQETLEQGDSEGVRVVTKTGNTTLSVGSKVASNLKQKHNTKLKMKEINGLSNSLDKSIKSLNKTISIESNELANLKEKTSVADKDLNKKIKFKKVESPLKKENAIKKNQRKSNQYKLNRKQQFDYKKKQEQLKKDKSLLEKKEADLESKKTALRKKEQGLSNLNKKKKNVLKKRSFAQKSLSVSKSAISQGAVKYRDNLEQGDSEGVKIASQGASATAKATKKLVKSTDRMLVKSKKLSKKEVKAHKTDYAKMKSESKIRNQSKKGLQKKAIKKNMYYSKSNTYAKKAPVSLTRMIDNVKKLFKQGAGKLLAIKNFIVGKLVGLAGGGLIAVLPFFVIGSLLLMTVGILGAVTSPQYTEIATGSQTLSPEVEKWRSEVEKQAKEQGMEQYVGLILAIIQVETGGKGTKDIMQSSESQGWSMNTIDNEVDSIKYGISHLKNIVNILKSYNKGYEQNLKAIAQAYNFGVAFAHFVGKQGGDYSLDVSEKYSKEVVAPSLGNHIGATYPYINEVSKALGKPYLYWNGGNFMYGEMVAQYLGGGGAGTGDLSILEATLGQQLNNGECYGLTAYYVEKQGGPKMMGSGFMYAETIGSDYDWAKYGWEVIFNPSPADIKAGDVINWKAGGMLAPGIYGHTGVVRAVEDGGNTIHTYEQNAGKGRINAKYTRTYDMNPIVSIVRKK
ncbi:lysozyme family protein [Enterococcus faecalis]|uniref:CHAP domain-containing protein n=1 Tax=Enterococcus faecalis TaxID=1351 RepID=UPI002A761985|nr:lysozyme family protein [Enterococcus faecalis]MDY2553540.1 lysozyme family protein [Enterococcus faecalis]